MIWISTDLAMENKSIEKEFGGFLVYQDEKEYRVLIIGKKKQNGIAAHL